MAIQSTTGPFDPDNRLHEAIASFEEARDSGQKPDPQEWLARYGDVAGQLAEFFANQERVCRLAGALLPPDAEDKLPEIQDYQILEKLPASGQGVVYKARQISANRLVALKVIRSDRLDGQSTKRRQQTLDRFRTEAQAAARLQHPNIVGVHEIGETDGGPFYSMQYVAGSNLAEKVAQGPLSPEQAAVYIEQVALAIHVAHQHGILHRDLKPANILIDAASDRPLVADFGLAKLLQAEPDTTRTGDIIGTAPYMSPEQAQDSSRVTIASDVYSLGATLYALLTGRPPFQGDNPVSVLKQVIEEEPTAPRKLKPGIPRDLETICLKCLEKQPGQRYATAEEMAADLRRWRSGEPILARSVGNIERGVKWVKRNPVVSALMTAILVLLVVGPTGIYVKYLDAIEQEGIAKIKEQNAIDQEQEAIKQGAEAIKQAEIAKVNENKAKNAVRDLTYNVALDRILLAQAAYDSGNVALANERLDQVPPDLRKWEWHYLVRQYQGGIFTVYGNTGSVSSVAFSPDGTRLITGSVNANVLDARTGAALFELNLAPWGVSSVACSPDGKRFATGSATAKIWDARSRALLLELNTHTAQVLSVAFSPDGTRLATGSEDKTAKVWDARTGTSLIDLKGHTQRVTSVAFSPDGTRVVTRSDDKTAKVWDAGTGKELLEVKAVWVSSAAISPDGTRLATGSYDRSVKIWDARTGTHLLDLKEESDDMVVSVAFSPDGTRLVTGGTKGTAKMRDARTGTDLLELKGHTGKVTSVAFSPDGMRVVTASVDGTTKVWDARTGTPPLEIIHPAWVLGAAFSPDGTRLITGGDGTMAKVWDANTANFLFELREPTNQVNNVAISPDGTRLLTASSNTPRVWDAKTGKLLLELKGHANLVWSAAFSPDGKRLVTGSWDQTAKVWDAITGAQLLNLDGNASFVDFVAFSPNGTCLATSSGGLVNIRDSHTGRSLLQLKGISGMVAFSPDGKRLVTGRTTGSSNKTASVWDARTGVLVFELKGHNDSVISVAFSPDGTRLVTGSADMTAKIWDASTGTPLLDLKGHMAQVVAFSRDGTRLVTGSYKMAKIWDARTRQDVHAMPYNIKLAPRETSPDGRYFAFVVDDNRVRIIDRLLSPEELEYRLFWTRPRPDLHREEFAKAEQEKDTFAARFHLDRLSAFEPQQQEVADPQSALDALYRQGRYPEVILAAEKAIKTTPKAKAIYVTLANAHYQLWQYPQAAQAAQRHLDLCPNCAWALQELASCRVALDSAEEAVKLLEHTVQVHPNLAEPCDRLAWIYATGPNPTRNPEKALPLARRAAALAPMNSNYQNTLGVVYYRLGQFDKAAETLLMASKAINSKATAALNQLFLAMSYQRLGEVAKAKECFQRSPPWSLKDRLEPHKVRELEIIRAEAAALLGSSADRTITKDDGKAAIPKLEPAGNDTKDKRAMNALYQDLRDKDVKVRLNSAQRIGKVEPNHLTVVSILIEALQEKDAAVRRQAAEILGNILPRDEAALEALRDATRDMEPTVRAAAQEALNKFKKK